MKITKQQLINIIKEELEQVTSEGRYRQATTYPELYDALKAAIGEYNDEIVKIVLRGVLDDRDHYGRSELNEDGHTDVPSAVRKLKTSMEDAMEILSALEQMPDTELPSWWMSKVTLAADYLNKSRDYLLVSEDKEYVKSFYTAKEDRADDLIDKGVDPDIAYGVADDQMAKAGKKIKRKKTNEDVNKLKLKGAGEHVTGLAVLRKKYPQEASELEEKGLVDRYFAAAKIFDKKHNKTLEPGFYLKKGPDKVDAFVGLSNAPEPKQAPKPSGGKAEVTNKVDRMYKYLRKLDAKFQKDPDIRKKYEAALAAVNAFNNAIRK